MPAFGRGTWRNDDHDEVAPSVRTAPEVGYRHVDTARACENEAGVGEGDATADVDRDGVFPARKVWTDDLTQEDLIASTGATLERLGTDYLDLLYVHWPEGAYDPGALPATSSSGCARRTVPDASALGLRARTPRPGDGGARRAAAREPGRDASDAPTARARAYAGGHGIEPVEYSPLARGEVFEVPH